LSGKGRGPAAVSAELEKKRKGIHDHSHFDRAKEKKRRSLTITSAVETGAGNLALPEPLMEERGLLSLFFFLLPPGKGGGRVG